MNPGKDLRPALLTLLAAAVTSLALIAGNRPAQAEARAVRAAAPRPPLRRVDVSSRVDLSGGGCSFGPVFERAFRNMIYSEDMLRVRARPVSIGGRRLIPRLTAARADYGPPGFRNHESVVRLPPGFRWNGLRLIRLRANSVWEGTATALEFADRPARVRAALRRIGLDVPLPPEARDIPGASCSAQIMIEARGSGSSLTCTEGC